jgi:chromosomal replication initiation ATPase DnaA
MGEVLKFPTTGENYNNGYNPADPTYWERYCCELDAKTIANIVFNVSGFTLQELRRHNRKPVYVDARQLFVLLCVRHTDYSYPTIGSILARDHTSAMHLEKRKFSDNFKEMLVKAETITRYLTTT